MPTVQVATAAYADFLNIYSGIAGSLTPCTMLSGTLGGRSLGAGTYCFSAAATLTGTLTLIGNGPWLFEIGTGGTGALTATGFTIVGGNPCNATWWVRQAVTLTSSTFQGTILAGTAITMTNTNLHGRAFAKSALTMTTSHVVGCSGAIAVTGGRHHGDDEGKDCEQGSGQDSEQGSGQDSEQGSGQDSEQGSGHDSEQGDGHDSEGCESGDSDNNKDQSNDEHGAKSEDNGHHGGE